MTSSVLSPPTVNGVYYHRSWQSLYHQWQEISQKSRKILRKIGPTIDYYDTVKRISSQELLLILVVCLRLARQLLTSLSANKENS